MTPVSRRDAIRMGICAGIAIPAFPQLLRAEWARAYATAAQQRPYLEAALRAERWMKSVAIDTASGRTWPMVPGDATMNMPRRDLYSGTPGIVLFYLELHHHTGEPAFLDEAVKGALHLASEIPEPTSRAAAAGLYSGLAGITFVLNAVQRASGREDLRAAAARGARTVAAWKTPNAAGSPSWGPVTDIVSGNAGVGLALLSFRDLIGDEATQRASDAAEFLIAVGTPVAEGQRKWLMTPALTRELPNFSHGTGGVAYFLATLAQQRGEKRYLDAAMDGARYLKSLMVPSGDGMVIRHNSDAAGKDLFYLSWCHGPAGTARLWERLHQIDSAADWRSQEDSGARGIIAQGVPEKRTPGFWNNISVCCGNAGVADYFLARHRRTRNAADLAYARRHMDDLLGKSAIDNDRQKWVQAENRVSPEDVKAQTGWMQGAAGVAATLLKLDAAVRGDGSKTSVALPDSPWT